MSTPPRKVHFEFSPGLVWCQVDTAGRLAAMSADTVKVTCKHCRHLLDEHNRQQAEEMAAERGLRPGHPYRTGVTP